MTCSSSFVALILTSLLILAPRAEAQTSLLGPVQFTKFEVSGRIILGQGRILLPLGQSMGFTAPVGVTARTGEQTSCTVLTLVLGPVDLNLLGLGVHIDRLDLAITPSRGRARSSATCSASRRARRSSPRTSSRTWRCS